MKPMFSRHRTHDEVQKLCKKLKVPFDDTLYRERGFDTVLIGSKGRGFVIYNCWNGRFFGTTDRGVRFTSDQSRHDKQPWMVKLLHFFYVE